MYMITKLPVDFIVVLFILFFVLPKFFSYIRQGRPTKVNDSQQCTTDQAHTLVHCTDVLPIISPASFATYFRSSSNLQPVPECANSGLISAGDGDSAAINHLSTSELAFPMPV